MAIVIVDCFSSGADIARLLSAREEQLIHIQSSSQIPPTFLDTYPYELFTENFTYKNCIEIVLLQLKDYGVTSVIPGTESGVELSELIAARLGLPSNLPGSSQLRRNKFLMIDALASENIATTPHIKISKIEDINDCEKQLTTWPVVVKPTESAGSDGVSICNDIDAVRQACRNILGRKNQLGSNNKHAVIENYIDGIEYIVDLTWLDGECVVNDICKSVKVITEQGSPIYDYIELVDFDSKEALLVAEYAKNALFSLGYRYGASHTELMLTKSGPLMIESAARLAGASLPKIFSNATSYSSLDALDDILTNIESFKQNLGVAAEIFEYKLIAYFRIQEAGYLKENVTQDIFSGFVSSASLFWKPKKGEWLPKTEDLFTSPGYIVFTSKSSDSCKRDLKTLREQEANLYRFIIDPVELEHE